MLALVDIAVNLVENYLRLTGYLTLSEFEVQRRRPDGTYATVTDVDIMAIRMPDDPAPGDDHEDCRLLLLDDPVLELGDDVIDVIIGEVKQGPAEFNPGIMDHVVLHSMLRRVGWAYEEPLEEVVHGLQRHRVHESPGRSGRRVRTRLVAFGRSPSNDLHTISLNHMISTMLAFFEEHQEAFRPIQFREPAPAFLRLLLKAGFEISR